MTSMVFPEKLTEAYWKKSKNAGLFKIVQNTGISKRLDSLKISHDALCDIFYSPGGLQSKIEKMPEAGYDKKIDEKVSLIISKVESLKTGFDDLMKKYRLVP